MGAVSVDTLGPLGMGPKGARPAQLRGLFVKSFVKNDPGVWRATNVPLGHRRPPAPRAALKMLLASWGG